MPPRKQNSLDSRKEAKLEAKLESNGIEDVSWLCSLSDSELDLLISLKRLVLRVTMRIKCGKRSNKRKRKSTHEKLAINFDLNMLRAFAFVVMEYIRDKAEDFPFIPGLNNSVAFMETCNLLKCNVNVMTREEIKTCMGIGAKGANNKIP